VVVGHLSLSKWIRVAVAAASVAACAEGGAGDESLPGPDAEPVGAGPDSSETTTYNWFGPDCPSEWLAGEENEQCSYLGDALDGTFDALDRLRAARSAEGLPASMTVSHGCCFQLRRIFGDPYLISVHPEEDTPDARCEQFIADWGDMWAMGGDGMALAHERTKLDNLGGAHCIYQQTYFGVPVVGMRFVVHLDPEGRVTGSNGEFIARLNDPPDPVVDPADAKAMAQECASDLEPGEPELVVHKLPECREPRLAWIVHLYRSGSEQPWSAVSISAITGEVLAQWLTVYID
jgi:hypothetical protein